MSGPLTRWDPFGELADLRARFDRMFEEFGEGRERTWTPAIDVVRDSGKLVLRADIPGIEPKEVKVAIEDDVLTVSGEHTESTEKKGKDFVRRERHYGAFSRSIPLPAGVETKKVKAQTHDGVLEVTIPLPKTVEGEKIEITPTAA